MRSFWNFLMYNNGVPIGLFILFGMGTAAFAATPVGQQALYSAQDKVVKVDNTYIVNADIPHFDFQLQITGITDDATTYYVAYSYSTIDLVDYVWKPVTKTDTLKFSKQEMMGHDLGLAVSKQLGQLVASQMVYLASVQTHEKANGQTQKTVDTEYAGLVGKFLDPTEKTFPGYVPVVAEATSSDQAAALGLVNSGVSHATTTPSVTAWTPTQDEINAMIEQKVNDILAQKASDTSATATTANTPTSPPVNVPPPTPPVVTPPPVDTTPVTPPVVSPPVDITPPATTTSPVDTPPVDTPPATITPPVTTPPVAPPATTSPDTTLPPDTSSTTQPTTTSAQ